MEGQSKVLPSVARGYAGWARIDCTLTPGRPEDTLDVFISRPSGTKRTVRPDHNEVCIASAQTFHADLKRHFERSNFLLCHKNCVTMCCAVPTAPILTSMEILLKLTSLMHPCRSFGLCVPNAWKQQSKQRTRQFPKSSQTFKFSRAVVNFESPPPKKKYPWRGVVFFSFCEKRRLY